MRHLHPGHQEHEEAPHVLTPTEPRETTAEPAREGNGRVSGLSAERVRSLHLPKDSLARGRRFRLGQWVLGLLIVAGLAAGVYYLVGQAAPGLLKKTREVDTAVVRADRLVDVALGAPGYVVSRSQVTISPKIPGTIVELNFAEGQRVHKGDVLARLEDWQYRAEVEQAKAAVKIAEARLEALRSGARPEEVRKAEAAMAQAAAHRDMLQAEFNRMGRIKDTISPSEFDRTQSAYLEAKAAAEQLKATLELVKAGTRQEDIKAAEGEVERAKALQTKAEYFLDATMLRSPIHGVVLEKNAEVGEMVRAETASLNASLSICVLANLDEMEAEIDIQERDLAGMRLGQPCLISIEAYPGLEYRGTLSWLAPLYNRQRGIRQAKITIQKPDDRLSPDMSCRVQVLKQDIPDGKAKLPCVPQEAVCKEGKQAWVFMVQDGVLSRREVYLGQAMGGKVEIVRGLEEGEVVALTAGEPLADGQQVQVANSQRSQPKSGSLLGP